MSSKPRLPKGTRDFDPATMMKREFIMNTIRTVFKKFGFMPLETPAMENLDVLMGKYGDEGDRLLFKILNSGDYLSKSSEEDRKESSQLLRKIAEKGLRYDLTVPFARFVAANRHELAFPFKRYQMQPVWRADRPQKGRYREFYQCDADVVGTESLICEAEIYQMIREVFSSLSIKDYTVKFNHREILRGLSEYVGQPGRETDLTVAIDKLDKIGWDGVSKELESKGFEEQHIEKVYEIISLEGNNEELLSKIAQVLTNDSGSRGVSDIQEFLHFIETSATPTDTLEWDLSLARGLSYYTGIIIEVKINQVNIGSVSGGGRYDDLTGVFGLKDVPGVGFSFGIDRIYDAMNELDLFPSDSHISTQVLIAHFDEACRNHGMGVTTSLRNAGIYTEIYPDLSKIKKQLQYADRKNIPFVLFIGSEEMSKGVYTLRNLTNGEEMNLTINQVTQVLNEPHNHR